MRQLLVLLLTLATLGLAISGCKDANKEGAVATTQQFLSHVRIGEHDAAFKLMNAKYRSKNKSSAFRAKIDTFEAIKESTGEQLDDAATKASAIQADVSGTLTGPGSPFQATLIKEGSSWGVREIKVQRKDSGWDTIP